MQEQKSFILYNDLISTVEKLNDKKAGALFKLILRYANKQNPVVDDLLLDLVFEPIKNQLDRDVEKWKDFRLRQAERGKLGGRPRNPAPVAESGNA